MWFIHKGLIANELRESCNFYCHVAWTHNVFPFPCHSWMGRPRPSPKSAPLPARHFSRLAVPSSDPQKGRAWCCWPTHVCSWAEPVSWNQHRQKEALNTSTVEEPHELEGSQLLSPSHGTGASPIINSNIYPIEMEIYKEKIKTRNWWPEHLLIYPSFKSGTSS